MTDWTKKAEERAQNLLDSLGDPEDQEHLPGVVECARDVFRLLVVVRAAQRWTDSVGIDEAQAAARELRKTLRGTTAGETPEKAE